ncbi:MAG: phosphate ABC transporter substrate-binding protein PstS [Vulcanimicrobiaceae bacterium]
MQKVLAAALVTVAVTLGPALAAPMRLVETGSTLLYPLFNEWVAVYGKNHADVQITTQGTGSGTGISQAVAGVAQIGASDAYMSDSQLAQTKVLNIPLAISAQQINYNIAGLGDTHLRLSGPVLAGIYGGTVRYWDDPQILALNPHDRGKLPHQAIVPIHRADGSGDTFIFTQYLSFTTPSWKANPGFGTSIAWPAVPNAIGAQGNPGMVQSCKSTPYSIAYIGVSFLNRTNQAGLGYAALRNRDGNFVLPTQENVAAAAESMVAKTPKDERISLIFAPGRNSYPIINYEYAIVNPKQPDGDTAKALKEFLGWAISKGGGNSAQFLDSVHFIALPDSIVKLSKEQIEQIG